MISHYLPISDLCQDLCPAVYIESSGPTATHHPHSLGCFNYVGSLMSDEYPLYSNTHGMFLTPDSISNPVLGRTRLGFIPNKVELIRDLKVDSE